MKAPANVPNRTAQGGSYPTWRLLFILMLMNVVAYLDRSILTLAAPQLKSDLGLDNVQVSILLGLGFVIFFVLLGIPFGWVVDRFSRRFTIFAGILFWSVSACSAGLARSFWQLLTARVGVGAGEAVLNPSAYSLIADSVPRKRLAFALSIYGGSAGLGAAVSVAAGGTLLGIALAHGDFHLPVFGTLRPWQFVLLLSGLPGLVIAPLIFTVPEPARRDRIADSRAAGNGMTFGDFLRTRWRVLFAIIGGFSTLQIMSYGFSNWQPTWMVEHFGWQIGDVGLILSIGMLGSFAGSVGAGIIVDRLIARGARDAALRWGAATVLFSGAFIVCAFLVDNALACVLFVIVAQVPLSLIGILSTALQQITPNEFRGRTSALFLLFGNLVGFGLGPLLPAMLTDYVFASDDALGLSVAIVTAIVAPVTSLLIWSGWRSMRVAVDEAQAWRSDDPPHAEAEPAGVH